LDLKAQFESIRKEVEPAIGQVLANAAFAGGPYVEKFEKEFATFTGTAHAVGVSSGTSALRLALVGLGIGPGDEVITVPNTFMATAEAISLTGAKPVFVDIEPTTYTMSPERFRAAITSRTAAVIPVHLFGQTAEMDDILKIARGHGLAVVEDAAQAHGAEYRGRSAGSMGQAGCYSFYPGKNLGAYGEAGAVVTNDADLAEQVRMLRDHGQSRKYHHKLIGWNDRMDGIQGAVLSVKLRHLAGWNDARRALARIYGDLLRDVPGLPVEVSGRKHIYHIYAVRVRNRDRVLERLVRAGVQCGIHYPVPVHLQEAYAFLGRGQGSYPVAERCADELLSLPMYPELSAEQIAFVCRELRKALAELPPEGKPAAHVEIPGLFQAAGRPLLSGA
jgi:dTDP-4-amino-4,6-dideoxygalactose transaminase